jgi:C4-dicarboxylate-specific signal transduction histidine kinase
MMATNKDAKPTLRPATCLAFAGRVAASVTHELNNVLSTISELSGLLADVAASDPAKGEVSQERLERIATSLMAQVKRGAAIVKRLNRFAHSSDTDIQSVNVNELVGLVAGLTEPLTRRHSVTLETDLDDTAITIQTNAFLLEQLLYLWIDDAASASERGQTVRIVCRPHAQGCVIEVIWSPKPARDQSTDQVALLDALAQELQGEVKETSAEDGARCRAITLAQART